MKIKFILLAMYNRERGSSLFRDWMRMLLMSSTVRNMTVEEIQNFDWLDLSQSRFEGDNIVALYKEEILELADQFMVR